MKQQANCDDIEIIFLILVTGCRYALYTLVLMVIDRHTLAVSTGSTYMSTLPTDTGEPNHPSSSRSPNTVQDVRANPQPAEQHPERRKNRTILIIVLTVVALFVLGIGIVVMLTQPKQLTLTETDAGKTFVAHTGDQITIQLAANATTGFAWAIDKTDTTVLALQRETYTPYPGGAIGSGGTAVFIFRAQHPGTVHLQLKYWRSWEGDSSIVKRYDVTIQVQ
jgi:predicted secreted protein